MASVASFESGGHGPLARIRPSSRRQRVRADRTTRCPTGMSKISAATDSRLPARSTGAPDSSAQCRRLGRCWSRQPYTPAVSPWRRRRRIRCCSRARAMTEPLAIDAIESSDRRRKRAEFGPGVDRRRERGRYLADFACRPAKDHERSVALVARAIGHIVRARLFLRQLAEALLFFLLLLVQLSLPPFVTVVGRSQVDSP